MPIDHSTSDPAAPVPAPAEALVLPDRLDNAEAAALRDRLLALRFRPLVVDGQALMRLGVLPAQVLASAAAQWRLDRQSFRLIASDACRRDMVNLGFTLDEMAPPARQEGELA
jgi:anti-anti-sigma regulatory factor